MPISPSTKERGSFELKIAVATSRGEVAEHFGRCPEYTIFTVEDGKITGEMVIPNPGHEPGFLPGYLAEMGVECIIAGGMGPRAQGLFAQRNIETITGVRGPVRSVVAAYLAGRLQTGEDMCRHGSEAHKGCDY